MPRRSNQLIEFSEELAVLLNSGADLDSSLAALISAHDDGEIVSVLTKLRAGIRSGERLSIVLEEHPSWFDQYFIGMVQSGEESGQLGAVLEQLAAQLEADSDLKSEIQNALVYPAILIVTMGFSLILVLGVILPRLSGLFESAPEQLSPAAAFVFSLGEFISDWGYLILVVSVSLMLVTVLAREQLKVRKRFIAMVQKIPLFKTVLNQMEFARFTGTLSSLLESGLSTPRALSIASRSFKHALHQEQMRSVISKVKDGKTLSMALEGLDGFSELHRHSIANGEQGGQLAKTLRVLSKRLRKDFTKQTTRLAVVLEPALIICLGLVIGLVVYAVFSAIQSVGSLAV